MSSAKESNTSKTAHVMNLLSRNRGGASIPAPAAGEAPAAPQPASAQTPVPTPPIIASIQNDIAVASKIKDALEASLMQEEAMENHAAPAAEEPALAPAAPAAEDAPPQSPPAQPEEPAEPAAETASEKPSHTEPAAVPASPEEPPAPVAEEPEEAAPSEPVIPDEDPLDSAEDEPDAVSQEDAPECQTPSAEASSPADERSDAVKTPDPGDATVIVNIMEMLVDEMSEKYISLFGLCRCEQCRKDVIALALNHLPPQYVVMPKNNIRPRLAMYESRFSASITAQILFACKEVLENPRHDPEQ